MVQRILVTAVAMAGCLGMAACRGSKSEAGEPSSEPSSKPRVSTTPGEPRGAEGKPGDGDEDPVQPERTLPEGIELDGDCIAFDPTNDRSGPGPSIATFADLDLDELEKLMPVDPRDPDLADTKTTKWRRGEAGHGSSLVTRYVAPADGESASIQITDLNHICTCNPGMGQRMLDLAREAGSKIESIGGHEFAVIPGGKSLGAWAGDRCEVGINAASEADARGIAQAIDWPALEALCKVRDPKAP